MQKKLSYNDESKLMKVLKFCTEYEDIEKIFNEFNISTFSDKISYLRRVMGVEQIYDAPQKGITEEDDYEFECEAFTEGSWRLLN